MEDLLYGWFHTQLAFQKGHQKEGQYLLLSAHLNLREADLASHSFKHRLLVENYIPFETTPRATQTQPSRAEDSILSHMLILQCRFISTAFLRP